MQNETPNYMLVPSSPSMPPALDSYYKGETEEVSHLRDYWHILLKRKWWFLGVLLGTVGLTLSVSGLMSPIYKVTTTIQILQDNPSALVGGQNTDPLGALTGSSSVDKFYETQYNILKSPTIAKGLIDTLNLKEHPSYKKVERDYPKDSPEAIKDRYAWALLDSLKVDPVKNSFLVDVSFKSTDKNMAWKITEAIPKEYLKLSMSTREQSYTTLREWLDKELVRLGQKLQDSERTLYAHGQKQDFLSMEEPEVNVVVKKYVAVSQALTAAQADKANKEAQYKQIKEQGADAPLITNHPLVTALRQSLIDLEGQVSGQSKIFGPNFPEQASISARMREVRQRLNQEVRRLEASIKADYEAATKSEALLQKEFDLQRSKMVDLQNDLVHHHVLKRDLQTNQTLYEGLLARMKEASVASTMVASNVSVITPALDPYEPWLPKYLLFTVLAVVLGSMFGMGTSFFVEYMDDSIKTMEEMEKICHISSLGVIPMMKEDSWKLPMVGRESRMLTGPGADTQGPAEAPSPVELLSYNNPMSMLGEAIQHIRTSLLLSTSEAPPKVIVITSGNPGEGKTTVSVNLAAALAGPDRRCVILDCDLRKARVHQVFRQPVQPGLTNYLTGASALEDVLRTTSVPNLYFLPAGPTPPNPNELFSSSAFTNLINHLRGEFDHIILDSPPIIGFADGRTISTIADGVLLVIRHHFTTREAGQLAMQLLSQNNARILGGILTMTKKERMGYGGYYGYFKNYHKYYGGYNKQDTGEGKQTQH
ncbi:MAG: polysaccharide biosynthesis tyrosine autokinase [Deltaproteobacteria bacterium]|nr:MAG: polysaccharide biosynthesis tyrosine autokinase [Deltaproteobacteria bacterium]